MEADSAILAKAEIFFKEHVRTNAEAMDGDPEVLRIALNEMCRQELMALRRPDEFGGPGVGEQAFRQFQEMSARYSGALSFLVTQHQSAVGMLAKSNNEQLKAGYLPKMANGELLSGIGFSQLRRTGLPITRATPTDGGFQIDGQAPWITGFGFYQEFLIGATLPDGSAVYGFVPFAESEQIQFSPPMKLAAMEAAQTVSATLFGLSLPNDKVVFVKPEGWAQKNDMINIVLQGHFALGCAQAGVDQVRAAFERKQISSISEAAGKLQIELDACRTAATAIPVDIDAETTPEKLRIRAWAIQLAAKCAHAGVIVWGGAAISSKHPAQRIFREAMVYSVSAQTTDILEASLSRISG